MSVEIFILDCCLVSNAQNIERKNGGKYVV